MRKIVNKIYYTQLVLCRYAMLWLSKYRQGKKLFIDNLNLCPWRPIYGKNAFQYLVSVHLHSFTSAVIS